jgi:hypothetical protein
MIRFDRQKPRGGWRFAVEERSETSKDRPRGADRNLLADDLT